MAKGPSPTSRPEPPFRTGEIVSDEIEALLGLFEVAGVTRPVIDGALRLGMSDFEDAVLHEAARLSDGDGIVTRNARDFKGASLRIYTPEELLSVLRAGRPGG